VLVISGDRMEFKLPTMELKEFPVINFSIVGNDFSLDKNELLKCIDKVMFCALKDAEYLTMRFNAVYWEFEPNKLCLVASDSFRLALATMNTNTNVFTTFLLSLKSMEELKSVLSSCTTKTVAITEISSQILFKFPEDDIEIVFNVLEQSFPEYEQIVPDSFNTFVVANTEALLSAIKRVSIASNKDNSISCTFSNNNLNIYASSPDIGEAQENMGIKLSGQDLNVLYTPKYLKEALEKIETVETEMKIVGDSEPAVLKPLNDNTYFYVIMPQRKV